MKQLRKLWALLALVMVLAMAPPHLADASAYVTVEANSLARVTQVVTGDALRVQLDACGRNALVRLAGVNAHEVQEATDFLTANLLGQTVELQVSRATVGDARFEARWTPVYVIHSGVLYNYALVQRGLASVDPLYAGHWLHAQLTEMENWARSQRLGIWAPGAPRAAVNPAATPAGPAHLRTAPPRAYHGTRININTADASLIDRALPDTDRNHVGAAIVRHRERSPFQEVGDIKFANVLTRSEFRFYQARMKVSTNINTATESELAQLIGVGTTEARNIVRHREQHGAFANLNELRNHNLMSARNFEDNRPFMAVTEASVIVAAIPNEIACVNTANQAALERAGLTSSQARNLVDARGNGYTLKHMGEIQHILGLTLAQTHYLADNLRVGGDALHRDTYRPVRMNINAATWQELRDFGFTSEQANQLNARRGRMNSGSDIPFNISEFDRYITLFTNANTASVEEWMGLSSDIPRSFAEFLVEETQDQPFGSLDELRSFFREFGFGSVYDRINRFIVLR